MAWNRIAAADSPDQSFVEMFVASADPALEDVFVIHQDLQEVHNCRGQVSSTLEFHVFMGYVSGLSREDIARSLNRPLETVDSAVQ